MWYIQSFHPMNTANKVIAGNLAFYAFAFWVGLYGESMTPDAYETTRGLLSICMLTIIGFNIWHIVKKK
jgi:hypothetical protein